MWRSSSSVLGAFVGINSDSGTKQTHDSVQEAEHRLVKLSQCIADSLREKDMIEDDFEMFKTSHEKLRGMFRDLVEETEQKKRMPPPFASKRMAKRCRLCSEKFGVFKTRRHCRNCGQIFCRDCSNHFTAIPHFGYDIPVRCCTPCFNQVSSEQNQNTEKPPISRKSSAAPPAQAMTGAADEMGSLQHIQPLTATALPRLEASLSVSSAISLPTVHRRLPCPPQVARDLKVDLSVCTNSRQSGSRADSSVAPSTTQNISMEERIQDARMHLRKTNFTEPEPFEKVGRVLEPSDDQLRSQLLHGKTKLKKTSHRAGSRYTQAMEAPRQASPVPSNDDGSSFPILSRLSQDEEHENFSIISEHSSIDEEEILIEFASGVERPIVLESQQAPPSLQDLLREGRTRLRSSSSRAGS